MLKNTFELAKNTISKNLIIFNIFLKKILEFFLCHQIFGYKSMLILMPLLNYYFAKKQSGKKDLILPFGLSSLKIIFTLLAKIIII